MGSHRLASRRVGAPSLSLALAVAVATTLAAAPPARAQIDSVCARVSIRIEQEAVITRTAFRATLEIGNQSDDSLDEVLVRLDIRDAEGRESNDLFGIPAPELDGVTDVSGTGMVSPHTTGTARWLMIPTDEAAPGADAVSYFIGGEFSYVRDGALVTVRLFPVRVQVLPDAKLFLKYFLQSPVYSDNPFTADVVEPAEPFNLGLLVRNEGYGRARNLRITSSEPRIFENSRDLAIAFRLLGAQVDTAPVAPAFAVDFGDVEAGGAATARWLMTASLQGRFIDYHASFEHVTGLGDPRLSLIESVDIFELAHIAQIGDDPLPDFLVNNPPAHESDDLPDHIHTSSGPILPVQIAADAVADGLATKADLVVQVSATLQPGWNYVRLPDPGGTSFRLVRVTDAGTGAELLSGGPGDVCNAWTTHRWLPIDGPPEGREDNLHILTNSLAGGAVTFMVEYVPHFRIEEFVINGGLQQRSTLRSLAVRFSDETSTPSLITAGLVNQSFALWRRHDLLNPDTQVVVPVSHHTYDALTHTLTIDLTGDGPGGTSAGLLTDGNYELRISTGDVTAGLGDTLPDGDGTVDGVYRFGTAAADGFYQLTGDSDGDRSIGQIDLNRVRGIWLTTIGGSGYNPEADLNGDGVVNFLDVQLVRSNWMRTMPFEP